MNIVLKYILQFVISGSVVVIATLIASRVDQKWAGLIVAFPIWTVLTYIFLSLDKKQLSHNQYLISAMVFMVPAAFLIFTLYLLNKSSLWFSLPASLVIYSIVVLVLAKLV